MVRYSLTGVKYTMSSIVRHPAPPLTMGTGILPRMDKQRWRERARCKDITPQEADELFFFGPGKSSNRAKAFCMGCPVKTECNNYAILYGEVGAWAGMADAERDAIAPILRPALQQQAIANGTLEDHDVTHFIMFVQPQTLLDLPA